MNKALILSDPNHYSLKFPSRKYVAKLSTGFFFSKVHGKVCTTKNLISGHKMAP